MLSRRWFFSLLAAIPLSTRVVAQVDTVPPPDGAPETVDADAEPKQNVASLKAYYAALNGGDIAKAVTFYAPDTRNHGRQVGRAGLTRVLTDLRTMFPDFRHDLVEITATGDVVVSRNKVSGTHKGVGRIFPRCSQRDPSTLPILLKNYR